MPKSRTAENDQQHKQGCDVCLAQFSIFPFHSTIGNMFVAKCNYVVKLIPPKHFEQIKDQVMAKAWNMTWEELGLAKPRRSIEWQFHRESWVGVKRFAMEHWMYSHPSVRPCDVFHVNFSYQKPPENADVLVPKRQRAPMANTSCGGGFHPWFKLQGRLYEYHALYSELPCNTSWIYDCHAYDS